MKKTTLALSALVLSLGLALSLLSATAAETSSATTAQQIPSLAPMPEKVMLPVVSINVEGSITINTSCMPRSFQQFFGDDFPLCQGGSPFQSPPFCQGGLDGDSSGQQQKLMALGSGVITDTDEGYVVTNNHIIDNTTAIKVQLSDGRKFDAKIAGKDPRSDVALIQIQSPKNLTTVKMTDSDASRVNDHTVAIGNPPGLDEAVTLGIVSALGRNGLGTEDHKNFIQTDAAISWDNSGGALVNLNGELIGINTVILTSDGENIGIGFIAPDNMMENLTLQMMEYSQVKRGELGTMGTELNSDLAKAMKIDAQRGTFASQVLLNSSAAKTGIKAGDVITSSNGKSISSFAVLHTQAGTMPADSRLALGLLYDGKQINTNLELQQGSQNQVDSNTIFNSIGGTGMSSKGKDQGVVVNSMKTGTPTAQIDLKGGDVTVGTNQQVVKDVAKLRKVLDSKLSVLALNIRRDDSIIYLLMQQSPSAPP